jgi:shikimate dehydrogenase
MTDVYGIFGHPIGHSRSPAMHNGAFAALGLDAVYVPFGVHVERLSQAVAGIVPLDIRGLNITLPHKTAVIALLDRVEPDALAIGAVNTIYREGQQLVGANTDAPGLTRALQESGVTLRGARVTVVGAGGAARASIVGLARAGASQISVIARRAPAAEHLVSQLTAAAPNTLLAARLWDDSLSTCLAETDLLVQATSATLDDGPAALELANGLPLAALPAHAAVVDLVYRPLETRVLRAARELGLRSIDGLGMLLYQGAIAFEKWTGRSAPIEVMRAALGA